MWIYQIARPAQGIARPQFLVAKAVAALHPRRKSFEPKCGGIDAETDTRARSACNYTLSPGPSQRNAKITRGLHYESKRDIYLSRQHPHACVLKAVVAPHLFNMQITASYKYMLRYGPLHTPVSSQHKQAFVLKAVAALLFLEVRRTSIRHWKSLTQTNPSAWT